MAGSAVVLNASGKTAEYLTRGSLETHSLKVVGVPTTFKARSRKGPWDVECGSDGGVFSPVLKGLTTQWGHREANAI